MITHRLHIALPPHMFIASSHTHAYCFLTYICMHLASTHIHMHQGEDAADGQPVQEAAGVRRSHLCAHQRRRPASHLLCTPCRTRYVNPVGLGTLSRRQPKATRRQPEGTKATQRQPEGNPEGNPKAIPKAIRKATPKAIRRQPEESTPPDSIRRSISEPRRAQSLVNPAVLNHQ